MLTYISCFFTNILRETKKSKGTGGLVGRPDALVKVPGIILFSDNPLSAKISVDLVSFVYLPTNRTGENRLLPIPHLPTYRQPYYTPLPAFGNSRKAEKVQLSLLKAPTALFKDHRTSLISLMGFTQYRVLPPSVS